MVHHVTPWLSWGWYPELSDWRWWYCLDVEDAPYVVWSLELGHFCVRVRWKRPPAVGGS